MNWLVWRQHKRQFLILGVLLALYAAVAIPMGLHLWHTYQYALEACKKADDCSQLSSELFQSGWSNTLNPNTNGFNPLDLLILTIPLILGVFVGVPLIAREYNDKTNLLIWTRSVSRRRWLTTKLLWILVATVLFAGGITALVTWWARAGNAISLNRFPTVMFDIQGITPIGYAVFAVSIGIALGAWLKRTMVAIALTMVLVIAAQIVVGNIVRPHYMTAHTVTAWTTQLGPGPNSMGTPSDAWVTSTGIVNKQGQTLNWSVPPQQCIIPQNQLPQPTTGMSGGGRHDEVRVAGPGGKGSVVSVNGGPAVQGSCLEKAGYHYINSYQPGYRYWDFQRIELGLYLALSLLPISATYWLVLKRDA
jgi:ABC-type transport system involved in multi-copper enzyme maturation permease subunit